MAYFYFDGSGDGDLDNLANYKDSDAAKKSDGAASTTLPEAGDTVWVGTTMAIITGTCAADLFDAVGNQIGIHGGVFNGRVSGGQYIDGGTFNGQVDGFQSINNAIFNDSVQDCGILFSGTFNGTVQRCECDLGDFYGNVSDCTLYGGDYFASASTNYESHDPSALHFCNFHDRMSFDDIANPIVWLYSLDSPAVAPADKVLAGTSNLGVAGTAAAGSLRVGEGVSL